MYRRSSDDYQGRSRKRFKTEDVFSDMNDEIQEVIDDILRHDRGRSSVVVTDVGFPVYMARIANHPINLKDWGQSLVPGEPYIRHDKLEEENLTLEGLAYGYWDYVSDYHDRHVLETAIVEGRSLYPLRLLYIPEGLDDMDVSLLRAVENGIAGIDGLIYGQDEVLKINISNPDLFEMRQIEHPSGDEYRRYGTARWEDLERFESDVLNSYVLSSGPVTDMIQ